MDPSSSVSDILRDEIEKIKHHIKETDVNLRKYSNTAVGSNRNPFGQPLAANQVGWIKNERRPLKQPLDEEQYEEELPNKPSLLSLVGTAKSREDVLKQQSDDKESKGRNRRMFGLLLGTLQQFKVEEKEKINQLEKRKLVEQKVQVKEREERFKLQKMRGDLITDKRSQQIKLRRLMEKMEIVELHNEWEKQCTSLQYFIRTSAKPNIFYLPKSHTDKSLKKLQQSKRTLLVAIEKRRKQLEEDIQKLIENDEYKSDNESDEVIRVKNEGRNSNKADDRFKDRRSNRENDRSIHKSKDKKDNKRDNRKDKEDHKENEIKKRRIDDNKRSENHRTDKNPIKDHIIEPHSDLDEDAPQHQVAIDYEGTIAIKAPNNETGKFHESMDLPIEEIKLPENFISNSQENFNTEELKTESWNSGNGVFPIEEISNIKNEDVQNKCGEIDNYEETDDILSHKEELL